MRRCTTNNDSVPCLMSIKPYWIILNQIQSDHIKLAAKQQGQVFLTSVIHKSLHYPNSVWLAATSHLRLNDGRNCVLVSTERIRFRWMFTGCVMNRMSCWPRDIWTSPRARGSLFIHSAPSSQILQLTWKSVQIVGWGTWLALAQLLNKEETSSFERNH